jgi:peroxiredoxin
VPGQPGFLPSRNGFAFPNSWPSAPAVTVRTSLGTLGIGNAAAGLCGGMAFAALDYWHAGIAPPAAQPKPGSPLLGYVVRRQIASWHLPAGVARYYRWMNLPDGDVRITAHGRRLMALRGVSWQTIAVWWPRVKASLDAGTPAALGVVTVASRSPAQLRHNHQVVAFGYALSGSEVTLRVYDPNSGPDDNVWIRFDTATPRRATAFTHNLSLGWPVRGFFLVGYSPAAPPISPGRPALPHPKGRAMAGHIAKGDLVEDFELPDETGTPRRLSDLLSGGPVVLFFYPAAMTRGCTMESCHFRDLAKEFAEVGAVRVGISRDGVSKQRQFADKYSFGYPLLSDADGRVARQFGVRRSVGLGPLVTKRMTFVIGTDRRVLDVIHSEVSMDAHADRALQVLRASAAT